MDYTLIQEVQSLRSFVDANPRYESIFVDYLVAVQTGDDDKARTAITFLGFYAVTDQNNQ